jgi:hypothetical protein
VKNASRRTKGSKNSDAAQHKRFLETAKKLEASETPEDFDRAFKRVTRAPSRQGRDERSR